MKKTPCMGCSNRELGCHGNCEKYAEYRNECIDISRKRREHNRQFGNKWVDKSYKLSKYSPLRTLRTGADKGYYKGV